MQEFSFSTRVYFGEGALERLRRVEDKRVLIVTDKFMNQLGVPERVASFLSNCTVSVFDGVVPDPPIEVVTAGGRTPTGIDAVEWDIFGWIRHVFVAGMISIVFCTMYSLLPNNQASWKEHYPGAVVTSVFWTLYSFGFSVYIDYFGGFSMYGSLTSIVIVMIWLYFCMYIFFCGALVNKWIADGYVDDYLSELS